MAQSRQRSERRASASQLQRSPYVQKRELRRIDVYAASGDGNILADGERRDVKNDTAKKDHLFRRKGFTR